MASQELFPVGLETSAAIWGDEAGELGPLAVDRRQQAADLDRDRDLAGERSDQADLAVDVRPDVRPAQVQDTRDPALTCDRYAEQASEAADRLGLGLAVLGVGEDVLDLLDLTRHQDAAGDAGTPGSIGMAAFVGDDPVGVGARGSGDAEDVTIFEIDRPEIRVAEADRVLDDRGQHGGKVGFGVAEDAEDSRSLPSDGPGSRARAGEPDPRGSTSAASTSCRDRDVVGRHRPRHALQVELADGPVDHVALDGREGPLAQQDLAGLGLSC